MFSKNHPMRRVVLLWVKVLGRLSSAGSVLPTRHTVEDIRQVVLREYTNLLWIISDPSNVDWNRAKTFCLAIHGEWCDRQWSVEAVPDRAR